MMRHPRQPAAVLLAVMLAIFLVPAERAAASESFEIAQAQRTGHVYLLRGFMNVFSLGMDSLARKLQAQGVSASVHNHSAWSGLTRTIAERHGNARQHPVILVGHSLGADAAVLLAARLAEARVPVALVITFDPVNEHQAPPNVQRLINFYQSGRGWGRPVASGPGFRGNLTNRDLRGQPNVTHTSIDKEDTLHEEAVREVMRVTRRAR